MQQQSNKYEQLINRKMNLINDFESGKKQYLRDSTTPIKEKRPDTPEFSDRKQDKFIMEQIQYQIIVNWQKLSDIMECKPYCEEDLYLLMNQLYLHVDKQFWHFCLFLAYNEDTWLQQNSISQEKMMKILGLIFDCVQEINDLKLAQLEEVINYRSITHLDRLLFKNNLPQFEKFITQIRLQILHNPHAAFTIKERQQKEKQFDSFANIQGLKSYTPNSKPKPSKKGVERSEILYNYSKIQQEKANLGHLVRVKQEDEELRQFQSKKRQRTQNGDEVFDRLFNDSKTLQNKFLQQQANKDVIDKECTFKPEIKSKIITKSDQKVDQIPGFETTMKRMQKAQNEKEFKEKFFEIKLNQLEKVNNNKAVKQFRLSEKEEIEEPIMFMDIRISKNKIGRLGIRKNDDVEEVVKNFAKTFSLQKSQMETLQEHINQALLALKNE